MLEFKEHCIGTLLSEGNLSETARLKNELTRLMDHKNVHHKGPYWMIHEWFMTHYVKWFVSDEDDNEKPIADHGWLRDHREGHFDEKGRYHDTNEWDHGPEIEPSWMKKPGIKDFTSFWPVQQSTPSFGQAKFELEHMIDYFKSLDDRDLGKINRQSYKVIEQKIKEWDEKLAVAMEKEVENVVEGKDYKVLKTLGNGWRWVELLTEKAYQCEGNQMGHCVGSYNIGEQDILSLWDSKNESHVTIERTERKITQIKGKQNRAPDEKYQKVTKDFVNELVVGGSIVTGDGFNIGMIEYHLPTKDDFDVDQHEADLEWDDEHVRFMDPETPAGQKIIKNILVPDRNDRIRKYVTKLVYEEVLTSGEKHRFVTMPDDLLLNNIYLESIEQVYEYILQNKDAIIQNIKFNLHDNIGWDPQDHGESDYEKSQDAKARDAIHIIEQFDGSSAINFVEGRLNIERNRLKNFIGCPDVINGDVDGHGNQLESLEGIGHVNGNIYVAENKITTLKHLPVQFDGHLDVSYNQLTDLEDMPALTSRKKTGLYLRSLLAKGNKLTSLYGLPIAMGERDREKMLAVDVSNNKLTSLMGSPGHVIGTFNCSFNPLESLDGIPKIIEGDFSCMHGSEQAFGSTTKFMKNLTENHIRRLSRVDGNIRIK